MLRRGLSVARASGSDLSIADLGFRIADLLTSSDLSPTGITGEGWRNGVGHPRSQLNWDRGFVGESCVVGGLRGLYKELGGGGWILNGGSGGEKPGAGNGMIVGQDHGFGS